MILIDYNQVVISNITANIGTRDHQHLDADLLRHMILNTLRSYNIKHKHAYGEMVIACDSTGRAYWRKDLFPHYKAGRKKIREASKIDWTTIFDVMQQIRDDLIAYFPYKVIHIDSVEADDIIGTLIEWGQENYTVSSLFDVVPRPILIVSSDGDFLQLQKYRNVKQYSPMQKKYIVAKQDPHKQLLEKILRGDAGDGIPNVLSDDDVFVKGDRQKAIMAKKVEEWIKDPDTMPDDMKFRRNFTRNKNLIDLTCIPNEIQRKIINTYMTQPKKDRSQLMNYFVKNKFHNMLDVIQDF